VEFCEIQASTKATLHESKKFSQCIVYVTTSML